MKLGRTLFLSSLSTVTRLAAGLISIKYVAVVIGPSGVALVGQLSNFISMTGTVASGAINTGVISYTSKYLGDLKQKHKLWRTSVWICFVNSSIIALLILLFRKQLSIQFLHSAGYESIFAIFAVSLIFYVWNQLLLAILNGQQEIGRLTKINMFSNILSVIFSIILVNTLKIYGALLSIVVIPNIIFFVTLFLVRKSNWLVWSGFFGRFDKKSFGLLFNYTLMAIVGAIIVPLQQLIIRNLLINRFSIDMAGCWQGLQKISDIYLLVVYTAFGSYFLPKLSSLNSKEEIMSELKQCYKIIAPIVAISIIMIYLFRNLIIHILFAKTFNAMGDMFFWQLIGDFFKTIAWPLGLIFVAKGKSLVIGFNDILFNALLVLFTYSLINIFSYQAAVLSFAITYFLWFAFLCVLVKRFFRD